LITRLFFHFGNKNFQGFRVSALSLLPIKKETLKYGSATGGLVVLSESEELNSKMALAAQQLNIKPHIVGFENPKMIYSCADIEGSFSLKI
jgi:hypothetical protein